MASDRIEELEARIVELEAELQGAKALTSVHYAARTSAEREAADAQRRGVLIAIRWIRGMPRRELVESRMRVGAAIYQRVGASIARYLEERLEACDEHTQPSLPPTSDRA